MQIKFFRGKIATLFITLLIFSTLGVVGYMYIEDYGLIDAIFMTVITLTTVGFGEVNHSLSQGGRVFTIVLILSGVGLFFYAFTLLGEELLNGNFIKKYRARVMRKKLAGLENHIIICGYGKNGKESLNTLKKHNETIVVIENDPAITEDIIDEPNTIFLKGDATEDLVLENAGVKRAKALISAFSSDADNLYVVLTSRQMSADIKIISRATQTNSLKKLKIAGADCVVMPDKIGGQHMASLLVSPDLIEFLERISVVDQVDSNSLVEVSSEELDQQDLNLSLGELKIREKTGCTVIGFKTKNGEYLINPDDSTLLEENTFLIVLGRPFQLEKLRKSYNLDSKV